MSVPPLTQDQRYKSIVNAIWFSAQAYVPPDAGKPMLATVNVEQTAHVVISILDDLQLIPSLPIG